MGANGNVLLDTSIVIAHFRQDSKIGLRLESYDAVYLQAIAIGELYHGAFKTGHDRHFQQVEDFERDVIALNLSRHRNNIPPVGR